MARFLKIAGLIAWSVLLASNLQAAEAPRVLDLRTQNIDEITYFHVRIALPADLRLPAFDTRKPFSEADRRNFARLPRLVPLDGTTRAVYYRYKPASANLSFYGQALTDQKARFLLLYPLAEAANKEALPLPELVRSPEMAEAQLEVDFRTARKVAVPKIDPQDLHLPHDDLRGNWALYQAAHFAVLETQVLEFGFYSFAREAVSRKYGVVAPAWVKRQAVDPQHRLYEVTTGADAITETLQLHRMLNPETRDKGQRTLAVAGVQGVTVAEQPWQRLIGDKQPALEPTARLVPDDNYYVRFNDLRKFIEFGDLMEQWGTSVLRVYELKSRDCRLKERYEQQLCLRSTVLAKTLGPALVKSVAVTGSDPYVREGTDVTVIFRVTNRALFLAAVEGFLKEARREHADRLREGREEYRNVTIESFVTPLREVSLHRTAFGDFVIYSNSPVGIRRVIDTHQGKHKALADALDFKYMRTVFPLNDKDENGFVFLSDPFIRQLVGPASRIKEKRRLEALTSISMLTNAALFHAWETGKLPADHAAALAGAGLKPEDVSVPEGKPLAWDPQRQMAVSDVYNTLHFATPLIELPIDKITPAEEKEYARFRNDYEMLWRRYFDPIGIRIALDEKQVRVKTRILPVVNTDAYRAIRNSTKTGKLVPPLATGVIDFRLCGNGKENDWWAFQVDESELLQTMVELLIRWEANPAIDLRREYDKLFWKLPIAVAALDLPDADKIVKDLQNRDGSLKHYLGTGKSQVNHYKKVAITSVSIDAKKYREVAGLLNHVNNSDPFSAILALVPRQEAPAALHLAIIDKGLYFSANEDFLKKMIDQAAARKNGKERPAEVGEANAVLSIHPDKARDAAGLFLEYEGHSLALLNNQVWNCFYQSVLPPDATDQAREATVRKFLGYLPVSPDGSSYRYHAGAAEIVNSRHGSFRQPKLHMELKDTSELGQFLKQVRAIRAELRFADEGLDAVLTIQRQ